MPNFAFSKRLLSSSLSILMLANSPLCAAQTITEPTEPSNPSAHDVANPSTGATAVVNVDFNHAVEQMNTRSPKLAAAKAEVESKKLQSDAAKWLG